MGLPYGETVTWIRHGPPTTDEQGNEVPGPATETDLTGCAVWPRSSAEAFDERTQGRNQVIVGLTLIAPYGTGVTAADQFRIRGELFEVEGVPGVWSSPFTGTRVDEEVALRRVTG